jgi:prephenate dehydratase
MKKICIQGYEGSFHQEAARRFFGNDVRVVTCDTFRELVRKGEDASVSDGSIMAIENSIAGSILPNYTLLQKSNLKIIGEVYLHIRQQLLANKNVKLSEIREVHSHPMALLQCMEYLETHPNWKLVESEDTALSAKHIYQNHNKTVAAIASPLAGELYKLDTIAPDIHTMKNNYTRFLVLARAEEAIQVEGANKASVNFCTIHQKGSLAKVLTAIAVEGLNLSKLQSMPIPGSNFQYSFHADMEFETMEQFNTLMKVLEPMTDSMNVLGIYKNGNGLSF